MIADPVWPDYSQSTAVVIGVSAYQDPVYQDAELGRLVSAANSRNLMRRLLTDSALCGWPPERVEAIPDPADPGDLAVRLTEIARRTTGTLLLYYVGHGELTATGELVLTVTTTRADAFKQTGLRFDLVRDAFNTSTAPVKIAILDCCGSGTIIPTVLGSGALAHRAAVKGTHILTAATGNGDAHRPPAHINRHAPTSFTAAFAHVLRRGLPDKPDLLTLADLFPALAAELWERGLPEPGQAISDTAIEAPFTRNAATFPPIPVKRRTHRDLGLRPPPPATALDATTRVRPNATPPPQEDTYRPVPAGSAVRHTSAAAAEPSTPRPAEVAPAAPDTLEPSDVPQQPQHAVATGSEPKPGSQRSDRETCGRSPATAPAKASPGESIAFRLRPLQLFGENIFFFIGAAIGGVIGSYRSVVSHTPTLAVTLAVAIIAGVAPIGRMTVLARFRLTLTQRGVEVPRKQGVRFIPGKTTMIPWARIRSVQRERGRVTFVLADGDTVSPPVPVRFWYAPDAEFDQKLRTIQQWHARFRSVAPPSVAATPAHQPIQSAGPTEPPGVPRRVVAFHMAGVVVAAGCFIAANFLPIGSSYWTDMSSGVQTAQHTLTFTLFQPWARQFATGPDAAKVRVEPSLPAILGLGTAVMLAFAAFTVFSLLLRSAAPGLQTRVKGIYVLGLIWEIFFAAILVYTFATDVFKITDAPGLHIRAVAQSGGWMLFAASVIVSETLRRTERHLRPPGITQASQRRSPPNTVAPETRTPR